MNLLSDASAVAEQKRKTRELMRRLRLIVDQKEGPDATLRVMKLFVEAAETIGVRPGMIVAGYWPIITEIDDRPLLTRAAALGAVCALPVIAGDDHVLEFRQWNPGDAVVKGARGTFQPQEGSPLLTPDIVITPVLAMDRQGYRLGQGGGYYDHTLARLRATKPVIAVGLGYHIQLTACVAHDASDERLDWLLTENELIRVI